mgnify:CR=1 FL=1
MTSVCGKRLASQVEHEDEIMSAGVMAGEPPLRKRLHQDAAECVHPDSLSTPSSSSSTVEASSGRRKSDSQADFLCQECGKVFVNVSNLRRHLKLHSESKKFSCPECPLTFPRPDQLASHMRVHQGERPFICQHCRIRFTTSSNLRRHERRIHPGLPSTPTSGAQRSKKSTSTVGSSSAEDACDSSLVSDTTTLAHHGDDTSSSSQSSLRSSSTAGALESRASPVPSTSPQPQPPYIATTSTSSRGMVSPPADPSSPLPTRMEESLGATSPPEPPILSPSPASPSTGGALSNGTGRKQDVEPPFQLPDGDGDPEPFVEYPPIEDVHDPQQHQLHPILLQQHQEDEEEPHPHPHMPHHHHHHHHHSHPHRHQHHLQHQHQHQHQSQQEQQEQHQQDQLPHSEEGIPPRIFTEQHLVNLHDQHSPSAASHGQVKVEWLSPQSMPVPNANSPPFPRFPRGRT